MPRVLDLASETRVLRAAQTACVTGLSRVSAWGREDVALRGGGALALAWQSPRHFDRLSFRLAGDVMTGRVLPRVVRYIEAALQPDFGGARVEILPLPEMPGRERHILGVLLPGMDRPARVRLDFRRMPEGALQGYDSQYRAIGPWSVVFPVASPAQIMAETLVGIAAREVAEWSLLHDVVFLRRTQAKDSRLTRSRLARAAALHETTLDQVYSGLERHLERGLTGPAEQGAAAGLRPLLEPQAWSELQADGMDIFLETARATLATACALADPAQASQLTGFARRFGAYGSPVPVIW